MNAVLNIVEVILFGEMSVGKLLDSPIGGEWAQRSLLTPFSMLPVWHKVPSAAGMLLVTQRLLLLRHHSSLHTS